MRRQLRSLGKASPAQPVGLEVTVMSRTRFLSLCLLFLPILSLGMLGQDAPQSALSNAGVIKMVKAGLPESIILREIQMSRTNFDTSPNGLIDLRKHGASEAVLHAVLDS